MNTEIADGQIWKSNVEPTRYVMVYSTRPMPQSVQVLSVIPPSPSLPNWNPKYRARVVGIPPDRLGSKAANGFSRFA